MHRITHYHKNVGTLTATFTLGAIAFFVYIAARSAGSLAAVIVIPTVATGLLAPALFIPLIMRAPNAVLRYLRFARWAIAGLIILHLTNTIAVPPIAGMAIFFTVVAALATDFWILSDKRFHTDRHPHAQAYRNLSAYLEQAEQRERTQQ